MTGIASPRAPHRSGARALTLAGGAIGLALLAVAIGIAVRAEPLMAPAAAGALAAGIAARTRPAAVLTAAFLLTGAFGTLEAFTALPAGVLIDGAIAGLALAAAWVYLVAGRTGEVTVWPGVALLALFIAVTFAQALTADDVETGLRAFHGSAWYMLAALVVAYVPWTPLARRNAARGVLLAGLALGAYACLRLAIGPADEERAAALALGSNAGFRRSGDLPLIGGLRTPKELAAWCATVLPFVCAAAVTLRGAWRLVAVGAGVVLAVALFGSEARLGLVAAVAGLAVVLVLVQFGASSGGLRLGTAATVLLASTVILGGGYLLAVGDDEVARQRYVELASPTQIDSFQERQARWEQALVQVRETPGGLGLGTAGGTARADPRFQTAFNLNLDNSYLKVALEQGALVLLFVVALLALLGGLARRAVTDRDPHRAGLAMGAAGAGAAFAVLLYGGLFIEGLTALTAWLIIGLGLSAHTAPRDQTENVVSP